MAAPASAGSDDFDVPAASAAASAAASDEQQTHSQDEQQVEDGADSGGEASADAAAAHAASALHPNTQRTLAQIAELRSRACGASSQLRLAGNRLSPRGCLETAALETAADGWSVACARPVAVEVGGETPVQAAAADGDEAVHRRRQARPVSQHVAARRPELSSNLAERSHPCTRCDQPLFPW